MLERLLSPSAARAFAAALFLASFGALGCQARIGDPCQRSTDCSFTGERTCDLSQASRFGRGECTIEGCGRGSCPDEAACIKVYGNDFLSVACDPDREDRASVIEGEGGEVVLPPRDDCTASEVCLPEGLCADEITARTSCRRKCRDGNDCRSGYECRWTGSRGMYRVPDPNNPTNFRQAKICIPRE